LAAHKDAIKQTGAPVLTPAAIYSEQHAEIWRQVLRDTEGSSTGGGGLISQFNDTVPRFKFFCEMLSMPRPNVDDGAAAVYLQQWMSDVLRSVQEPWQMDDHGGTQQLGDMAVAGNLLPLCNPSFSRNLKSYLSASAVSFCCGNPSCTNLAGWSEVELLMGGAAERGGGYCSGCKKVCYCSKACRREGWEEHIKVCTKYQQEEQG
jgi:hypothetical protein